jgi:hypothetical protein
MVNANGPRSERGKSRSSQNAAKHWIESGRILPLEQKQAAFLRHGFVEDFNPQGLTDNEVIDDLVLNRLIRRRIDVAFTREFGKARVAKTLSSVDNFQSTAVAYFFRSGLSSDSRNDGPRLRPDRCIRALEALRERIKDRDLKADEDLPALFRIYGGEPTEFVVTLMSALSSRPGKREPETLDQGALKAVFLHFIEKEIDFQKRLLDVDEYHEDIEFASDIQEPAAPALETLVRYRSSNTREFKDLLETLERTRRLRRTAA